MADYIYDIESYPNIFTCCVHEAEGDGRWLFEISDRRNDFTQFQAFIQWIFDGAHRMVGFKNEGYD